MDLTDPTALALAIAEALAEEGVDHALYGGLLLAAYGEARETHDADLAVVRVDAQATRALLERRLGLHASVAFDRRLFGGLAIGRITLIGGDELNSLDLVEPVDPGYAQRALARAVTSTLRGRPIRVLTPEDFLLFKALSTRDLDLRDASSVWAALRTELDLALLEQEAEVLARSIPSHPLREHWERIRGPA